MIEGIHTARFGEDPLVILKDNEFKWTFEEVLVAVTDLAEQENHDPCKEDLLHVVIRDVHLSVGELIRIVNLVHLGLKATRDNFDEGCPVGCTLG